jgi:hypothetical protein
VADDLLLRPAERGIAENAAQCVEGSGHAGAVREDQGRALCPLAGPLPGIRPERPAGPG